MPLDHFSVSQLSKFLACALSYKFHYVDGIETGTKSSGFALGTAFHAAAEKLHKHLMNGGVRKPEVYRDALGDALTTEFGNFEIALKDGESRDSLVDEGSRLVDVYREYRTGQKNELVAAEHKIQRDLVNVETGELLGLPFVAYLDLIEENGEGLVIVDLKTAGKSYSQADVDANLQLTAYALMILLETGSEPLGLRIDAVVRNKTPKMQALSTGRSKPDYVRFFVLAQAIRKAINTGCFYPNPGWQCPTCEFAEPCRRWGLNHTKENKR